MFSMQVKKKLLQQAFVAADLFAAKDRRWSAPRAAGSVGKACTKKKKTWWKHPPEPVVVTATTTRAFRTGIGSRRIYGPGAAASTRTTPCPWCLVSSAGARAKCATASVPPFSLCHKLKANTARARARRTSAEAISRWKRHAGRHPTTNRTTPAVFAGTPYKDLPAMQVICTNQLSFVGIRVTMWGFDQKKLFGLKHGIVYIW